MGLAIIRQQRAAFPGIDEADQRMETTAGQGKPRSGRIAFCAGRNPLSRHRGWLIRLQTTAALRRVRATLRRLQGQEPALCHHAPRHGHRSHVALVNTRLQQTLAQMHPSPAVFDHAIAEVNLDGQIFWLDATANYQRGPLALRSWPNYGWALVIHPGTTDLTQIAPSASLPRTTVNEYLTLGNLNQESQMKIVTIAEGRDAETLRQQFATTARDAIERAHLNYYAKLYPDISQTSEIVYSDDEQQNKVEVDETYSVRNMWAHLPNEAFFHAHIYSANVASAMRQPAMSVRTMPLGVAYPQHQIFRAEVVMPSLSSIWPDDQTIENPAFYFHRNVSVTNGKLLLLYEYRSLANAVQPDAVPNYIHQLNTASDLTGYIISSN